MANPRNIVNHMHVSPWDTITMIADNSTITYDATKAGGSAQVGLAVRMTTTDETVELVGDGEKVFGKLLKVEADLKCTVQWRGPMTLPGGTSATLTIGSAIVGDLLVSAEGYIQTAALSGGSYSQAEQNVQEAARGIILNNDTTTAVVVVL